METFFESIINKSRWILVVFYIGLLIALSFFALYFIVDICHVASALFVAILNGNMDHQKILLMILGVVEMVMLANLVNIIKTGSFSIFIKKGDTGTGSSWLNHVDPGVLKIKISMALVNIAGVYLLSDFIYADTFSLQTILVRAFIYIILALGAFILAKTDKLAE